MLYCILPGCTRASLQPDVPSWVVCLPCPSPLHPDGEPSGHDKDANNSAVSIEHQISSQGENIIYVVKYIIVSDGAIKMFVVDNGYCCSF